VIEWVLAFPCEHIPVSTADFDTRVRLAALERSEQLARRYEDFEKAAL